MADGMSISQRIEHLIQAEERLEELEQQNSLLEKVIKNNQLQTVQVSKNIQVYADIILNLRDSHHKRKELEEEKTMNNQHLTPKALEKLYNLYNLRGLNHERCLDSVIDHLGFSGYVSGKSIINLVGGNGAAIATYMFHLSQKLNELALSE